MYYLGLRIDKLDQIGKLELNELMKEGQVSLILSKKNGKLIKLMPEKGRLLLLEHKSFIDLLFVENSYRTITSSIYHPDKPMDTKQLIRLVNNLNNKLKKKK